MSQSDFVTRGQALVSSGQYQEAVKVCRLGLLGRPTTVEGRVVLGQALLALKRFDEVLAEMRVALELDHTSVPSQVLKGEAMLRKGDAAGAIEVLGKLRSEGRADSKVAELLAEAERLVGRSPPSAISPVVSAAAEPHTKHYPAADPSPDGNDDPDGPEDTGAEFTRPTSIAAPGAKKRTPSPAFGDNTPPPSVLAVGDHSGTVEVDPDRDGVEFRPSEDDLGDVVGPPVSRQMPGQMPAASATVPSPAMSGARRTGGRSAAQPAQPASRSQPMPSQTVPSPGPPRSTAQGFAQGGPMQDEPRGQVMRAGRPSAAAQRAQQVAAFREEVSTVELDDEHMIEVAETLSPDDDAVMSRGDGRTAPNGGRGRRPPGPGTQVRNAVKLPSGPIDLVPEPAPSMDPRRHSAALPAGGEPRPSVRAPQPAAPPHLAALIASQPHVMNVQQVSVRSQIAAALPTAAAMPMPMQTQTARGVPPAPQGMPMASPMAQTMAPHAMPMGGPQGMPSSLPGLPPMQPQVLQPAHLAPQLPPHLQSSLAAARPTVALSPTQEQSAAAVDALFTGNGAESPAWARATVMPAVGAAGHVPSLVPNAVAPGVPGPMPGHPMQGHPMAGQYHPGKAGADERTRLPGELDPRIAAMVNGAGPGGPGGPSGFGGDPSGDRPMRTGMRKRSKLQIVVWILIGGAVIGGGVFAGFQIRAMRLRKQIAAARDRAVDLANSDTWQGWTGARDSLYGIAQASPTVDNRAALARARAVLGYEFGDGNADAKAAVDALSAQTIDALLAATYVALAQGDGKVARDAAERAKQAAPADAEVAADTMYVSGEALLLAGDVKGSIDDHKKALEKAPRPLYGVGVARALGAASAWDDALAALDKYADNPAAIIVKAELMAGAGRVVGPAATELRGQLAKVIAEGGKPPADQTRGVSPLQVALADLALAQVDFARGDAPAAHADYLASLELRVDDQRYAEALIETVYAIGDLEAARKIAARVLKQFPNSRRVHTALAQVWIALGKPNAALDLFTKAPDTAAWPKGQTVRGLAHQAIGDIDGARADFDAALKKLPGYEPALIARTWIDLAAGDLDEAKKRLEPRFNPKSSTAGMLAAYAEIQRLGGDPAARDKVRALLEHAVVGPGADAGKVQLELARIDRDTGDMPGAKTAYAAASRTGNFEARLEAAQLQLDDSDPANGRAMLEQLLKDSGDHPPASLLLETARARSLMGAHAGAAELLALAEKTPNIVAWQLDRERGRLALRKGDPAGAAQALLRALERCGGDVDSFLLAADTVSTDDKQTQLAQKLSSLVPNRLKGKPEADIIAGKLALAASKFDDAEKVYTAALDALDKEKATPRRRAQAAFGLAAVAYFKHDDPAAKSMFELVMAQDPSIFAAYLFAAELAQPKAPEDALRYAQQAAALNPDSLDAWKLVGTLASQLKKPALLKDAVTRVGDLAPGSETLHQLQALR